MLNRQYSIPLRVSVLVYGLHRRKTDSYIEADVAVCKQCSSVVKLAGGTSNMSAHMKHHHHPSLLLESPVENKQKADTLFCISQYASVLYQHGHKMVHVPVFFLYRHRAVFAEAVLA